MQRTEVLARAGRYPAGVCYPGLDVANFHLFLEGIAGLRLRQLSLDFVQNRCTTVGCGQVAHAANVSQLLKPLLFNAASLPSLRELSVTSPAGSNILWIGDTDVKEVARAGLKLRTLRLVCDSAPPHWVVLGENHRESCPTFQQSMTLRSLVHVARYLPELEELQLPPFIPNLDEDVKDAVRALVASRSSQPKLRRLQIGRRPRDPPIALRTSGTPWYTPKYILPPPVDYASVAQRLHDVFPALTVSCEEAQQCALTDARSRAFEQPPWDYIFRIYHLKPRDSDICSLCADL
ncbi:hypothetical protein BV20DRAFT_226229 [Pilatotrama ljubarskyi]|nr:hypothetical protein BV20DRAFT_226229 [Pilatotrama ljubarskyi]